jgi:hypothetical protein
VTKSGKRSTVSPIGVPLLGIDHLLHNVRQGRFEQMMSALTGVSALITGVEIWLEHDRASFSNTMMWVPVALSPVMAVGGIAGIFSCRIAKTFLPMVSLVVVANSLQGEYLHLRGVAQRPGGLRLARYNLEMGPPIFAPLLFAMVGGMGLLASVLRRED